MTELISSSEIIERAEVLGYKITKTQLARWHRAELLPHPIRQHPGRGSVSYYPITAVDLAIEIAELSKHGRSLDWYGWKLWTFGFDVPDRYWRAALQQAFERHRVAAEAILELIDSDNDSELDDAAETLFRAKSAPSAFKQIRKATGAKNFGLFLLMVMSLVRGDFIGLSNDDSSENAERREAANILDRGMGLVRARTDLTEGNEPWLSGDFSDILRELAPALDSIRDSNFIERLEPHDIADAREELFYLRNIILRIYAGNSAALGGGNAFGLKLIAQMLSSNSVKWEAGLFAVWLVARTHIPLRDNARDWIKRAVPLLEASENDAAAEPKMIRKTRKHFPFPRRK